MSANRTGLRIGNLLLFLCCIALAGFVYLQLDRQPAALPLHEAAAVPAPDSKKPAQQEDARENRSEPFQPAPRIAYAGIVERPLFNRTRRPIAEPEAKKRVVRETSLSVELAGIVVDGGTVAAFLKVANTPNVVRVTEGSSLEGWTVKEIGQDSVTLTRKGRTTRLSTRDKWPSGSAGRAAAPAKTPRTNIRNQERPRRKQNENRD
jgi:hypothetical protein